MHIEEIYEIYLQYPSIQTDSRKLQKKDLFFALKGANFNGNLFAEQALEKGAAFVFADEKISINDERIIHTGDVLKTLQRLAHFHRQQFNKIPGVIIPFIAITGSNGKTTTKELIHAVLSITYKTYTTEGNLNNHIGIPLTILKIKPDAAMAVIEMGANHLHEIAGYCEYAQPTHGLITNIGKAHLEGFGSIAGVKKGKGELYDYLKAHKGTIFAYDDYDYLHDMSKGAAEVIWYGSHATGSTKRNDPFLEIQLIDDTIIETKLVGSYNLPNVLGAIAIGQYFVVPAEKIKTAIESYIPSNSRSQLIEQGSNKIIMDAYNANPSSMKLAIENVAAIKNDNKVLLLGAMAELGEESLEEHKAIADVVSKYSWKAVALVGGDFLKIEHPYLSFENALEAKNWYGQQHFENSTILIKGSRKAEMEKIILP